MLLWIVNSALCCINHLTLVEKDSSGLGLLLLWPLSYSPSHLICLLLMGGEVCEKVKMHYF